MWPTTFHEPISIAAIKFSVSRMEMCVRVIVRVHPNDDSAKAAQLRHESGFG